MKIVLAYSGGLDTSVLVSWLKEHYNAEIITYAADVGQEEELDGLAEKAKATGCLLYTSPSPRDRTRSRMPSSA